MTQTTSSELQRIYEQAMANRRRMADYYRKRSALNTITGKPTYIKHSHRAIIGAARHHA